MNLGSILQRFENSKLEPEEKIHKTLMELVSISGQIPYPASGATLRRWQILSQVSASNLSLGKLFESHLDALAILHELNVPVVKKGLWAVWAAEGGPRPLKLEAGKLTGIKPWCSASVWVQHGLLTYRDEQQQSQLLILDLPQAGIQHHQDAWQAVGMQHTLTARLELDQVKVEKVAAPNAYLDRPGFWHGAAGVAACWYGATVRLAEYLKQAVLLKPHPFKAMYLGDISRELLATQALFYQVADLIDQQPKFPHQLQIQALRAQVEATALNVLTQVGKALGAAPYCEQPHFARLAADLPVFIRQSHAAWDLERIGELSAQEEELWTL
ncbi:MULTISPECIES: acyl-CoA dehydrogenase family protein [unclassified Acinetobacter]|uniref:acyl-CoA dehydrogenase family protein n=1 Tax=unclassified Acinetobacter TaxID=196816 RepID=UPI001C22C134|nr:MULTISPECIES: acyl-CoA dehydrogenase family protein [unclassified Acinetobacter]